MAGIGFELRKILRQGTLSSVIKAYTYAGLLATGPWLISMIAIFFIGIAYIVKIKSGLDVTKFQLLVTYAIAMASSLIFTSFFQLPFVRFVSDMVFEHRYDLVIPNLFGLYIILSILGFIAVFPLSLYLFYNQSNFMIIIFNATFVLLSILWLTYNLVIGLKFYRLTFLGFVSGYALVIIVSLIGKFETIEGIFFSFFLGNLLILLILLYGLLREYPFKELIRFDFLSKKLTHWSLGLSGFFYSVGIWIDKFIFWYHPDTGILILGRFHASLVYDIPVFLAYLSIVPGMAVFFYRLEADFAEKYERFCEAVRSYGTLSQIEFFKRKMKEAIDLSLRETIVIQGIFVLALFLASSAIFSLLKIPKLYIPLFRIDLVATQLLLGFTSVLAFLYYLDRRRETVYLTFLFLVLNILFTLLSIHLGPNFYGYGFAVSLLISYPVSLLVLNNVIYYLEYGTYMLQ